MSKWYAYPLALALMVPISQTAVAQEGGVVTGDLPEFQLNQIEVKLEPTFEFKQAEHVANGVALRNRSAGTIHLRGIPQDRRVIRAFLYWNFSDLDEEGRRRLPILINGNNVGGLKIAENADPCWGMVGNHTYRADVTPFIPANDPNQDYQLGAGQITGNRTAASLPSGDGKRRRIASTRVRLRNVR